MIQDDDDEEDVPIQAFGYSESSLFWFLSSECFDPLILNISLLLVLNVIAVNPETYKDTIQVARGLSKSRKPLDDGPGEPFFWFLCRFNSRPT